MMQWSVPSGKNEGRSAKRVKFWAFYGGRLWGATVADLGAKPLDPRRIIPSDVSCGDWHNLFPSARCITMGRFNFLLFIPLF